MAAPAKNKNNGRSAAPFVPARATLPKLRAAASTCTGCDLYKNATQTVFGAGPARARLVLIGEQPGDREDLMGAPFVGPAGKLLDRALAQAGLARKQLYVTNAVKHFKWERRGKRRLHKHPEDREIAACRPWLLAEVATIKPSAIVCLGVTAAAAVFDTPVRLKDLRGAVHATALCAHTFVTIHPSALLRVRGHKEREVAFNDFVADLTRIRAFAEK